MLPLTMNKRNVTGAEGQNGLFASAVYDKNKNELIVKVANTSDTAQQRDIFDPRQVRRLIDEHTSESRDHTRQLRALLVFELWQRTYLDKQFDRVPSFAELGLSRPTSADSKATVAA